MAVDPRLHHSFSVDRLVVNGFHIGWSRQPLTKTYDRYANPAALEVDGDIILHCDMSFDFRCQEDPPLRAASKLTPRSVTLTLGWSQDGTVDIADGTEVFLDGILTYLHRDAPIVKLTDIIVKPYVRHDRPDGHAYCLPGAIKPVIPKDWHSNVYFQSDCNCGNGKETGCEFEIAHLDTKGAYPCSPILPDWDTAREEVLGFFAELAFSDDESSNDDA